MNTKEFFAAAGAIALGATVAVIVGSMLYKRIEDQLAKSTTQPTS